MTDMKKIVDKINYLPAFSRSAMKAIKILQKKDFSINELIQVLKYDPSLTANIIKTANSAYYAHSKEIRNITTAINYLGREHLLPVIAVSASKKYFLEKLDGYEEHQGEQWEHNLAVAVISNEINYLEPSVNPGALFTIALLHDIGKVVVSFFLTGRLNKLKELVEDDKVDFITAEEEILGLTHPQIGAAILKKWKFPEDFIEVVRFHHSPEKWNKPLVRLVVLSDYIAKIIGKTSHYDALCYSGYESILDYYNIKSRELDKIISNASEKIENLIKQFDI